MQSNLSQTQAPVYDEYSEFDNNNYYDEEAFYYEDSEQDGYYAPETDGKQRVLWLLLIAVVVIMIAGVLIFGVVPYIETFTQGNPPPLPPAVQI